MGELAPTHYYDFDFASAWFVAPEAGLQTLLPPSLHPVEVAPGFGLVGASFFNYEDVEYVGPYREAIVSVLVDDPSLYEGYQPLFVLEITVNNEAAQ